MVRKWFEKIKQMLKNKEGYIMKLDEIAKLIGGTVKGDGNLDIADIRSIEDAENGHITFMANRKYLDQLQKGRASAVIVEKEMDIDKSQIIVVNPALAFARVIAHFYPEERDIETRKKFPELNARGWDLDRLRFDRGRKEYVIEVRGLDTLLIGRNSIDTRYLEQLAESGQLETCGWVLKAFKQSKNRSGVDEICNLLNKIQNEN